MSDNSFTTKEAHTLRSMMRRPEMAKLIKEAINTPVGSTSRMRAQKLFKIVNKLNTSYDGAGGPGMQYQRQAYDRMNQPEMDPVHIPTDNPKGVVIFHKIPQPKIVYGSRASKDKPRAGSYDGMGGPGIHDGAGGWLGDTFSSIASFVSRPFTDQAPATPLASKPATLSAYQEGKYTNVPTYTASDGTKFTTSSDVSKYGAPSSPLNKPYSSLKEMSIANSPDYYPGIQDLKPSDYWSGLKSVVSPVVNYAVKPIVGTVGTALGALGTATSGVLGGAEWLARLGINSVRNLAGDNSVQGKTIPSASDVFMWRNGMRSENVSTPLSWGFDAYTKDTPSQQFPALAAQTPQTSGTTTPTTTPSEALKNYSIANSPTYGPTQPGATSPASDADWLAILKSGEGNVYGNTGQTPSTTGGTTPTPSSFSNLSSGLSGISGTANTTGSQFGSAALNIQKALGGIDLNTPLSSVVSSPEGLATLVKGIIQNEGSSPAGVMNNPGNIKFAGLPGQIDSGVKATDGGTFASYATIDDGLSAIGRIVTNAAAGNSSSYGAAPTVGGFMNTYTNTGPGTTHGGGTLAEQIVNEGLNRHLGAGMTADAVVRAQTGMSEEEAIAAQRKSIRDLYGIDELREESWKLTQEQNILPKVAQDYIIQHDTYIKETDKNIGDYIDKVISNGSGDPADIQMAQSQLAYLYTVRGRQNQSYVQFIKDAVAEHQAKLDSVNHNLEVAINGYNDAIATELPLTQARYERLYNNAVGMYEEIKNAPAEAIQMKLYEQQLLTATGEGAIDSVKYWKDNNLIAQGKELEGYTWNKDRYVTPEMLTQPMQLLNEANVVQQQNPNIHFNNILDTYAEGYTNYLDAPLDKDANTGYGITVERKIQLAKNAILQWQGVADAAAAAENEALGNYAVKQIEDIIMPRLNTLLVGSVASSSKGTQYMEAVKQLAPTGWFGGEKTPPTEQEFVEIVTGLTGDAKDETVAKSIYSAFVRYMNDMDKPSPSAFVKQLLYDGESLVSPDEFSRRLGSALNTQN